MRKLRCDAVSIQPLTEQPLADKGKQTTAAIRVFQILLLLAGIIWAIYKDKLDGKAGMLTRSALGQYQKANNLRVDCWPTQSVLEHMQSRNPRN